MLSLFAPLFIFVVVPSLAHVHHHAGGQLVGVFDDLHPEKLAVESNNLPSFLSAMIEAKREEEAFSSSAGHKSQAMATKTYYCYETVIGEDGQVSFVKTQKPTCYLPPADETPLEQFNHTADKREKRQAVETNDHGNMAYFLQIPAKSKNFNDIKVDYKSYIHLWIRVCSEPGGQVLVVENQVNGPKKKQIMWFQNNGLAYRCNYWSMDEKPDDKDSWAQFMSETNEVRIEYQAPKAYKDCDPVYIIEPEVRQFVCKKGDNPVFELRINYKEVQFQSVFDVKKNLLHPDPAHLTEFTEMTSELYQPNQVVTYVFDRRKPCDGAQPCDLYYVGISIDVHQLDLDFDRGDYLLVGPGRMPQFRKNSLSQIISTKVTMDNPKRLWIDAERAFLRLVTHNSLKPQKTALQFRWRPADTNVTDLSQSEVNRRLAEASIPLCLMDTTLLLWNTAQFQDHFKKELLHIVNQFLVDHGSAQTTLISVDSIYLREAEEWAHFESDHKILIVQVNLAITSPYDANYPLLERAELEKLFFGGSDQRDMFASRVHVTNCQFFRISLWRILGPILAILIVSGTITGVFWYVQRKTTKDSMVFNADASQPLQDTTPSHPISTYTNPMLNDGDAMMY